MYIVTKKAFIFRYKPVVLILINKKIDQFFLNPNPMKFLFYIVN